MASFKNILRGKIWNQVIPLCDCTTENIRRLHASLPMRSFRAFIKASLAFMFTKDAIFFVRNETQTVKRLPRTNAAWWLKSEDGVLPVRPIKGLDKQVFQSFAIPNKGCYREREERSSIAVLLGDIYHRREGRQTQVEHIRADKSKRGSWQEDEDDTRSKIKQDARRTRTTTCSEQTLNTKVVLTV